MTVLSENAHVAPSTNAFRTFCIEVLIKAGISIRWGMTIFALLGVCGLLWRGLELYEVSVKAQSVEAQIALERHRLFLESMRNGGNPLTADQIKDALTSGAKATPIPLVHPPAAAPVVPK